jgi:opacity protein-like surface antigen
MTRIRGWQMALVMALLTLGAAAPASAEWFADLYVGAAIYADPTIKTEVQTDVGSASRQTTRAEADTDVTFGGRFGYWLEGLSWLGFAADVSYFEPEYTPQGGSGALIKAKLRVVPITPLVMLRLPLLQSPEYPAGRLQPYVGAGPGFFVLDTTVRVLSGLGPEHVSETGVDIGADLRAGVAWSFTPNWAVFGEYRFTHFSVSPSRNTSGGRISTEFDIDTNSFLAGVSFRWR